jgi:hypothetical protein
MKHFLIWLGGCVDGLVTPTPNGTLVTDAKAWSVGLCGPPRRVASEAILECRELS